MRVFADEGGSVVGVEFMGNAPTKNGLFEGVMKALGVLSWVVGRVGDEAAVVIDQDGQMGGDDLALRIGELGAGAEVGHPEIIGKGCLESFSWTVESIDLSQALAMKATISEEPVDGREGRQVYDLIVFHPSAVGDFDGDLRVVLPLLDEPVLLLLGQAAFLSMS